MRLPLPDESATFALGERLGATAEVGAVIAAHGTLGAGKTRLAQGVARGLGVPPAHYVNSPTFAIMQVHPGRLVFYHLDLYRIGDRDEALGLGLEEAVGTDGVALVEWPSRLPELFPADLLHVYLEIVDAGREAILAPTGPRSTAWLARAFKDERPEEEN